MTTSLSLRRLSAAAAITAAAPSHRLLRLTLSRLHGAAQPQLDPDSDCFLNEYYHPTETGPCRDRLILSAPVANTEGSVPSRGVQWAFIGSPHARKHVFAQMLSRILEVPHISMATIVRQELSPKSSLYKQIADAVNHGEIVPEDIILGLLAKRLEDGHFRGETGFILDGIPRSRVQALILDQIAEVDMVVNFKCTQDLTMQIKAEASWKQRFQTYIGQMNLLEDYYRKQRKLVDFKVDDAPVKTWRGLLTVLHLEHVNAALPALEDLPGNHPRGQF